MKKYYCLFYHGDRAYVGTYVYALDKEDAELQAGIKLEVHYPYIKYDEIVVQEVEN